VVRAWLADGVAEIAIASADEQTAGRGRAGRSWTAPPGTSLLLSAGFRPTYLRPEATWRLGAVVGLAMAQAAEVVAGLAPDTVRLKWPNDLVLELADGLRKLGGVLGESEGLGTAGVRAVVGIGLNVDWASHPPPADLAPTMTSLRTVARGPVGVEALRAAFLDRLAGLVTSLRGDDFSAAAWTERQVTTGRQVVLEMAGGVRREGQATGVDSQSGALLVRLATADDQTAASTEPIHAADVVHVRLAGPGV
jgi:BirA family biotin operon repressor/biotin-[acetyl-CoA-carboxylase] ligase